MLTGNTLMTQSSQNLSNINEAGLSEPGRKLAESENLAKLKNVIRK